VFVSDIISAGGRDKERDKGSVTSYFSFFRRAVGVSFSAVHLQNVYRWVKYCQLIARKYNQFMITEKYIKMIKNIKYINKFSIYLIRNGMLNIVLELSRVRVLSCAIYCPIGSVQYS
jgi:hypothetical protein